MAPHLRTSWSWRMGCRPKKVVHFPGFHVTMRSSQEHPVRRNHRARRRHECDSQCGRRQCFCVKYRLSIALIEGLRRLILNPILLPLPLRLPTRFLIRLAEYSMRAFFIQPEDGHRRRPGERGENGVTQGKLLNIQEAHKPEPDYNVYGSSIQFGFGRPTKVLEMGLMDDKVESDTMLEVLQSGENVTTTPQLTGTAMPFKPRRFRVTTCRPSRSTRMGVWRSASCPFVW